MLKKKLKKILKVNSLRKILLFILLLACTTNIEKVISKTKILIYQPNKKSKNIEKNNPLLVDIKWQKILKDNQKNIIWRKYINEKNLSNPSSSNKKISQKKKFEISSFNRSIIFNHNTVGPDINWLIPPGLKWNNRYKLDFSLRGNSGLENNKKFLDWNDGDAVGQIHLQLLENKNSSFGLNIGIRSIQGNKNLSGGHTPLGEGLSAGFRYDRKISDLSGFAIGGEQILHFDGLTDTGRDFYITATKAWISENKDYPIYLATGGLATGKMAEGNIKGLCTNLFGGSGTEVAHQRNLCWAPVFSFSKVYNKYFSNFVEYNSKHFLLGTSLAPFNQIPLRGTFAVVLSDHMDNYKLHNFNEMSYVFRVSLGF